MVGIKSMQYQCDSCGVVFFNYDTMIAHKSYYCGKRSLPVTSEGDLSRCVPSPEIGAIQTQASFAESTFDPRVLVADFKMAAQKKKEAIELAYDAVREAICAEKQVEGVLYTSVSRPEPDANQTWASFDERVANFELAAQKKKGAVGFAYDAVREASCIKKQVEGGLSRCLSRPETGANQTWDSFSERVADLEMAVQKKKEPMELDYDAVREASCAEKQVEDGLSTCVARPETGANHTQANFAERIIVPRALMNNFETASQMKKRATELAYDAVRETSYRIEVTNYITSKRKSAVRKRHDANDKLRLAVVSGASRNECKNARKRLAYARESVERLYLQESYALADLKKAAIAQLSAIDKALKATTGEMNAFKIAAKAVSYPLV